MPSILKLIRIRNLVLIVLLQIFLHEFLIRPIFAAYGIELMLSDLQFYLLVVLSVFIASAGYIINDYFDLRMDYINKPGEVLVGKTVKRRVAMALHLVLSGIGVLIGFSLAWSIHIPILGLVPLMTVGLLWFYSTDYKRQFLIGNIIISLLTIFPIVFLIVFEPAIFKAYFSENREVAILLFKVIGSFSALAFLLSFLNALVKDIHDMEGDMLYKFRTLPIVIGERNSKIIFAVIALIVILFLAYIQNLQYANEAFIPFMYMMFTLQIPLIFVSVFLFFTNENKYYFLVLRLMGYIMVAGLFSIPVLYYFPGV